ncbi:MAG: Efflux ABC transporter, ATP-binding protein, partial [uncultured Cytophagales bacterium]
ADQPGKSGKEVQPRLDRAGGFLYVCAGRGVRHHRSQRQRQIHAAPAHCGPAARDGGHRGVRRSRAAVARRRGVPAPGRGRPLPGTHRRVHPYRTAAVPPAVQAPGRGPFRRRFPRNHRPARRPPQARAAFLVGHEDPGEARAGISFGRAPAAARRAHLQPGRGRNGLVRPDVADLRAGTHRDHLFEPALRVRKRARRVNHPQCPPRNKSL